MVTSRGIRSADRFRFFWVTTSTADPIPPTPSIFFFERSLYRETVFLKGNHEANFLEVLRDSTKLEDWRRFSGLQTLMSYGTQPSLNPDAVAQTDLIGALIELDNNTVERSIRPIALNRKNALFAGSDGGAEHWATIASLIETCELNGVDPPAYLADVLTRIVTTDSRPLKAVNGEQRLR
jgi:IS66 C-terminal element/Transposase IS66 family